MVIIGVLMILAGLGAVGLGDSMNHDAEAQIRSVLSEGRTDPGNGLIGIGVFLIIIGVILLIAGIVSAHSNSSYSGGNSNHYNSNYSSYGYDNSQYGYSGRMQQLSKEAQERKLLDTNPKVVKTALKTSRQIDAHFLQVECIACGHFGIPSAVA